MLGHVPFRIRPWNAATVRPMVEPAPAAFEPGAPTAPVDPTAPTAPTAPIGPIAPIAPIGPIGPVADPVGVRVVPLRPASAWPARRARERVLSPFRAFPFRTMHLSRMMYADDD